MVKTVIAPDRFFVIGFSFAIFQQTPFSELTSRSLF